MATSDLTLRAPNYSHDPLITNQATNKNHDVFTTTVSMATKRGRMVTYVRSLLSIKAHSS